MTTTTRKGRFWPGMIIGLISLNFCVVAATVFAVHSKSASFAVEADYDTKALNWDVAARQLRHEAQLGWTVRIDSTNAGQLLVSITDKQGHPLESADIKVAAFHHAHAASKLTATFSPTTPGQYSAPLSIITPGLWEFRFTVTHASDTYTQSITRMILAPVEEPTR